MADLKDERTVTLPRVYWEWIYGLLDEFVEERGATFLPVLGFDEEMEKESVSEMREAIGNTIND